MTSIPPLSAVLPAQSSRISPTYNIVYGDSLYFDDVEDDMGISLSFGQQQFMLPSGTADQLAIHYIDTVLGMQYLLAGTEIRRMLSESVLTPSFSREAARLLAHVHMLRRHSAPSCPALEQDTTKAQYNDMELMMLSRQQHLTDDAAMAALNVISTFLFDGGTGPWEGWLTVANARADNVLNNRRFDGPRDALMKCDEQTSFLIRAAMWFDVLASITTQKEPHFLSVFQNVFSPYAPVHDPLMPVPPRLSMKSVMGCDTTVVWAMAETSALSVWKNAQSRKGSLSVPELVKRGRDIERHLTKPGLISSGAFVEDIDRSRELTSEIFRTATLVYLRSVVSGDHPHVAEIKSAIQNTIACIEQIPTGMHSVSDAVVRSTVFAFFICGCLTDSEEQKKYLYTKLDLRNSTGSTVGNGASVQDLLHRVWLNRKQHPVGDPVPWRDELSKASLLLV